jgi:hypothetical protein
VRESPWFPFYPRGDDHAQDFHVDHAHPSCSPTITTNCLAFPFNGDVLQVMPWPAFQNMTDRQLNAIYVYLSAAPCVEGGRREPPNRCR